MATLFKHEDGQAIRFTMPLGEERQQLSPLVQEHGGILSSRGSADIRLAVSGKKVHSEGFVSVQYIYDCIKEGVLLDKEKYKINPEAMSEVSDIEDESASNILKFGGENKVYSGRKAYLLQEDQAIIRYLLENYEFENYRGNKVWKDMAFRKVTNHTWQSMKSRFSKHILKNIKQYVMNKKDLHLFLKLSDDHVEKGEEEVEEDSKEKETVKTGKEKSSPTSSSEYQSVASESPSSEYNENQPKSSSPKKQSKHVSPQKQSKSLKSPVASTSETISPVAVPSTSGASAQRKLSSEEEATPRRSSPRKRRVAEEFSPGNTSSSSVMSQLTVIEKSPCSTKSTPDKESRKKPKKNDVMAFLQTQSQTFNESGMNELESEEDMEAGDGEEVAKLLDISKKICEWLDLTQEEFFHALYACNGSVSGAVNWILGDKSDAWNLEDDKCLLEGQGDSHDNLRETYGPVALEGRLKFLTEYLNEYR